MLGWWWMNSVERVADDDRYLFVDDDEGVGTPTLLVVESFAEGECSPRKRSN